jgi:hypothetical protein
VIAGSTPGSSPGAAMTMRGGSNAIPLAAPAVDLAARTGEEIG